MTRAYLAAAALLGALAATAAGQATTRVSVAPDSKLWIEGTSNLHGWSCAAEKFDAAIELDAAAVADLATATPKVLKRVEVKVPVKSLKCGHGGMDDNMYKALKADASPEISYIMATFDAVPGEADGFALKTTGTLTIAGKENKLAMDVVATRMPDGTVKSDRRRPDQDDGLRHQAADRHFRHASHGGRSEGQLRADRYRQSDRCRRR